MPKKVRKVIVTTKTTPYDYVFDMQAWYKIKELNPGTMVEVAVYSDAEPERELIQPEERMWCSSKISPHIWSLVVGGTEIAVVDNNKVNGVQWTIEHNVWHSAKSIVSAKHAVKEALATAKRDGFYWKEVEPECWFYSVLYYQTGQKGPGRPQHWRPIVTREEAQSMFDRTVDSGCWQNVLLYGFIAGPELKMIELDRYEKKNE